MKIHSMRNLLTILLALCVTLGVSAAVDPELGFDRQLEEPEVPSRLRTAVAARMASVASELLQDRFTAKAVRAGQVVEITIPCAELFEPNANALRPSGEKRLSKLRKFIRLVDGAPMYKVVIAVHSDDTGDDQYRDMLTALRAEAIEDYLLDTPDRPADSPCATYGLGSDEPLGSNATKAARDRNRRVEIYLVPDTGLFTHLKNK